MKNCAISDDQIFANMMDYSITSSSRPVMQQYSYEELKTGTIEYEGHKIRTSPLSSYRNARAIANELKDWIEKGEFELTVPAFNLPKDSGVKSLEIRE